MSKRSLYDSTKYRVFTQARDRALEQLHSNAQADVSRILHEGLERTLEIVSHRYSQIPSGAMFTDFAAQTLRVIDQQLDMAFRNVAAAVFIRIARLRKHTFLLSQAAEFEAISRAQGKDGERLSIPKDQLNDHAFAKTPENEDLFARIRLALNRIRRDVIDSLELSRVQEESLNDALTRVKATFPSAKLYKQPRKILKRVQEASDSKSKPEVTGIAVDDEEWDDMVSAYKSTSLPKTRFYNEPIVVGGVPEGMLNYSWEIENQMTHDFVSQVRAGQVVAANKAGIKEFVWIAVIDDRTDECCAWRDGLTTSEIRAQLEGTRSDDECQVEVPPAHFNCRCRLAPVGEIPERVESNLGEFEEWLNT